MLTLKQLAAKTSPDRHVRAQWVKVIRIRYGRHKSGLAYVAAQTYSTKKLSPSGEWVKNYDKRRYVSVITFLNSKLQCEVSCSCEDTTYRWEYANNRKGAAQIEYSNGQPPDITNPLYKPALCKHLLALYEVIKAKLPPGF